MYTYTNVHGVAVELGAHWEMFVQFCRRKCEDGSVKTNLHSAPIVVYFTRNDSKITY